MLDSEPIKVPKNDPNRLLKSVDEDAKARKKTAETGVYKGCEAFEDVFDAALATQVAFQQPANPPHLASAHCVSRRTISLQLRSRRQITTGLDEIGQ